MASGARSDARRSNDLSDLLNAHHLGKWITGREAYIGRERGACGLWARCSSGEPGDGEERRDNEGDCEHSGSND